MWLHNSWQDTILAKFTTLGVLVTFCGSEIVFAFTEVEKGNFSPCLLSFILNQCQIVV